MKAIDLVRAMVYDSDLAEIGGLVDWDGDYQTLESYFRAVSHKGEMTNGVWFYVYMDQMRDAIVVLPEEDPDVILKTEDAGGVLLWKVEE